LQSLGIEVAMGNENGASYCRDLMETSTLLDYYSRLGVPLHVNCSAPSGPSVDANSEARACQGGSWHNGWTEQTQADWLYRCLHMAASKPYVQEVTCSHFGDMVGDRFQLSGIIRADGTRKPAFDRILHLKDKYWT
jgi:hypothetical protein